MSHVCTWESSYECKVDSRVIQRGTQTLFCQMYVRTNQMYIIILSTKITAINVISFSLSLLIQNSTHFKLYTITVCLWSWDPCTLVYTSTTCLPLLLLNGVFCSNNYFLLHILYVDWYIRDAN